MAEAGVLVVKLTGGETLVRPDFLEFVDNLMEHEIAISTILTNGALLGERLLVALEERGVWCGFDVSFDGTCGLHDWLRGVGGAEEAVVRALRLCHEHGFATGVQFELHRRNVRVLRESVRMLADLGVSTVLVGSVIDVGEALAMREDILTFDEVFDACCDYLPQFLEDGASVGRITLGGIFGVDHGKVSVLKGEDVREDCLGRAACTTMRRSMYLTPDGYFLPCSPESYGDATKVRFPSIARMTIS